MVRQTLKILQQMPQDFKSVPDHFETLCIKGLINTQSFKSNRLLFLKIKCHKGSFFHWLLRALSIEIGQKGSKIFEKRLKV